jgi:polyphosphate kinase 2 (PPK2 family)
VVLPELGQIAIFNRSHYENVLVTKVHPELIWPAADQTVPREKLWTRRYEAINNWERHLTDSGTVIVKIFLNLSKDVQRERFLQRIDEPEKNWKFSPADLHERERWSEYRSAFSDMLSQTSTKRAPWYVVPADHKWATRLIASGIILHALEEIDPHYPHVDEKTREDLVAARAHLVGE